jgi:ABC-type nickel/cobalt efflux system permease component RcnA
MSFPFFSGLIASVLHVIMGPDHLAAVLPFVIESKRKAWKIGLFWGLGHILGMLIIGALFMMFKQVIPVDLISQYSEQLVGVVLIGIGIWAFIRLMRPNVHHKHLHIHIENQPLIHKHEHVHKDIPSHEHRHSSVENQSFMASFGIGILHGFAGIAHFILFLPVLGFNNSINSGIYIIGFILGIVLAMTTFSIVAGRIAGFARNEHNQNLYKGIRLAGGIFAILIGIYWMTF